MGAVLGLVRAGRRNGAVALLLSSLFGMVSLLMWQNGGLRDTSLLAFPCMLVFAAMLGTRRLYFGLFAAMVAMIAGVLLANTSGLHVNRAAAAVDQHLRRPRRPCCSSPAWSPG